MEVQEFMKVCKVCGEEKRCSPQVEKSDFYKHHTTKDGFENRCKACKAASEKARRDESKDRETTTPGIPLIELPKDDDGGERKRNFLMVDFQEHREIENWLADAARAEFRTPEQQALWCINKVMQEVAA